MSLPDLKTTLTGLHRGGLRGGLDDDRASRLIQALETGGDLSSAARSAGLDPRLAQAVSRSGVSDAPGALIGQARIAAMSDTDARKIRSAGVYPLVLAGSVLAAGGVLGGVMAPALSGVSAAPEVSAYAPLMGSVGLSAALLIALSLSVLGRLRLPLVGQGWAALDRRAFLESLRQLTAAGTPLPEALEASAVWCADPGPARALVRALEAGGGAAPDSTPLLSPLESAMLLSAARAGTLTQTTAALAEHQQVRLQRLLPDAILRIHALALVLAGGAVLSVGVAFFSVYARVLAG